jgi:hypothetical protein
MMINSKKVQKGKKMPTGPVSPITHNVAASNSQPKKAQGNGLVTEIQ